MTDLTKPVKRVSNGLVHESGRTREVVVILRPPNVIGFRAKGCRKEYRLTTEKCYKMAVWAAVEEARREKAKKKAKKKRHK